MTKEEWVAYHKQEVVTFIEKFYRNAFQWRKSTYHAKWDKYELNYNAEYDPAIAAKKETWQTMMFDSAITPTNVELTTNALVKALNTKESPLGVKPREMGDELQASLASTVLDYEKDRAGFLSQDYLVKKDACIYGSGFMKHYWVKQNAPVRIKNVTQGEDIKNILIKDDPKSEWIPIRNLFFEPNSTDMNRVLQRNKITYGELVQMSQQKNFKDEPLLDKASVDALLHITETANFEEDLQYVNTQLGLANSELVRADYDKRHTIWEYWGPIPRKWTDEGLDMPEDTDEEKAKANEIVPGKVLVASAKYYLASEVNPLPDMEPPYVQTDYIPVGKRYGIGVAQLLCGIQEEANEIRNLRVDNVNLALNKMIAVFEKFIVDPTELKSRVGGVIRLRTNAGGAEITDASKAFHEFNLTDVALSGFRETGELERKAQEVVGNNRVSMGVGGTTKDGASTATGMELLNRSAFERFTLYAFIIGLNSNRLSAKKLMGLSYQNSSPERNKRILGMAPVEMINMETGQKEIVAKYLCYKPLPMHEFEKDYDFIFTDIFNAENKAQKMTALLNFGQFVASVLKTADMTPIVERAAHYVDLAPEEITAIMAGLIGPQPTPLAMGQGMPSLTSPTRTQSGGEAPPQAIGGAGPQTL